MKARALRLIRNKLVRLLGLEEIAKNLNDTNKRVESLTDKVNELNHQVANWPNSSLNHTISNLRLELASLANKNETLLLFWVQPGEGLVNFGDEMGKEIIEKLFHKKVMYASADDAQILAVGSIIEYYNESRSSFSNKQPIYVWGSGVRLKNTEIKNRHDFKVLALRGELSAKKMGYPNGAVPLGDPGILANLVYPKSPQTGKIGIVPHMTHMSSAQLNRFKGDDRFIIINPMRDSNAVIKEITSCKLILSSSLHGLIVADSFKIPNVHVDISKLEEGDFKFKDYYSGVGREYRKYLIGDLFDEASLKKVINEYTPVKNLKQIQTGLIESFPYGKTSTAGEKNAS
jgi:pyruvyltransferase